MDIFKELTKSQVRELYFAVDFYKNIALLKVPGFYLSSLLEAKFNLDKPNRFPFQYVNTDFRRILDEEIVYSIKKRML